MSKVKRNSVFRVKRVLYRELAEFYGFHRNTLKPLLKEFDLRTLDGVIGAIRFLDNKKGVVNGKV